MFTFFKQLSLRRSTWLLVVLSSAALEGAALYFQYGLGLQPCVMCIYQRVALLGVMFAGIIGFLSPKFLLVRWFALLVGLFAAVRGLLLAVKHTDYQINPAPWNTCSPFLNFPETLPLDKWLPSFFAAGGDCGKISWEFLGLVMPQWLIIVFAGYILLFVMMTLSQFKHTAKKKRDLFH